MEMESLRMLHRSMMAINTDMQQFRVKTGAAEFDCLFCTREDPFILTLTSCGLNSRFFKFEVEPLKYRIKEYLGEMYGPLLEVLRIDGRSGEPFKPGAFLAQLNAVIPKKAKPEAVPSPTEIVRLRFDLEERDKPYFSHWKYWKGRENNGKGGPTKENRHKTLVIYGKDALAHSVNYNASSAWSPVPTGKNWHPNF
ncbi:MAG: hypothetical protein HC790_08345 [Acaryochloridaceae cyanobacterium CSU_3_4]|nr:hypothetical protein [Acaryochloridaceae cyanobacterium CSU_3_4]